MKTIYIVLIVIAVGIIPTTVIGLTLDNNQKISSQINDVRELVEQKYAGSTYNFEEPSFMWDCPEFSSYGTSEECIRYWEALSDLAEREGDYAMYKKLNNDCQLSDFTRQVIFDIQGIMLFPPSHCISNVDKGGLI